MQLEGFDDYLRGHLAGINQLCALVSADPETKGLGAVHKNDIAGELARNDPALPAEIAALSASDAVAARVRVSTSLRALRKSAPDAFMGPVKPGYLAKLMRAAGLLVADHTLNGIDHMFNDDVRRECRRLRAVIVSKGGVPPEPSETDASVCFHPHAPRVVKGADYGAGKIGA